MVISSRAYLVFEVQRTSIFEVQRTSTFAEPQKRFGRTEPFVKSFEFPKSYIK